jgi:hypothetical protein
LAESKVAAEGDLDVVHIELGAIALDHGSYSAGVGAIGI